MALARTKMKREIQSQKMVMKYMGGRKWKKKKATRKKEDSIEGDNDKHEDEDEEGEETNIQKMVREWMEEMEVREQEGKKEREEGEVMGMESLTHLSLST